MIAKMPHTSFRSLHFLTVFSLLMVLAFLDTSLLAKDGKAPPHAPAAKSSAHDAHHGHDHDHHDHAHHNHAKPKSKKDVLSFDFQNHTPLWTISLPVIEGKVVTVSAYEATGQDRLKVSAKPTDLILVLQPKKDAKIWRFKRLDVSMPDHKHGMNTLPVLKRVSKSRYHAKNYALHMPGAWQFSLTGYSVGKKSKKKQRFTTSYSANP